MNRIVAAVAILVVVGCSAPSGPNPASGTPEPQWKLEGTRIIGCCCLAPCPCRINKPPTHCHGCDGIVVVHVDRGFVGKTRMDGVNYVLAGRTLGEKVDGNWAYAYVSDQASDEQFATLKAMLEGEVQGMGPKAKYIVGRILGMRKSR